MFYTLACFVMDSVARPHHCQMVSRLNRAFVSICSHARANWYGNISDFSHKDFRKHLPNSAHILVPPVFFMPNSSPSMQQSHTPAQENWMPVGILRSLCQAKCVLTWRSSTELWKDKVSTWWRIYLPNPRERQSQSNASCGFPSEGQQLCPAWLHDSPSTPHGHAFTRWAPHGL